ncbi:MAG TPA: FAD binding domain-containing protein, partial [Pyrinomonadaceae bacterium]|nr:FAD binding domain-containing protein [Pyrinomonadaceae bacterium]
KTPEMAVSAVDGNICRCTGYKSIERAACRVGERLAVSSEQVVPPYFDSISQRLSALNATDCLPLTAHSSQFVGGGTDAYVQRPEQMAEIDSRPLLYDDDLRGIRDLGDAIEIGASATVTDLMVSPVMQAAFPDLYKHLKLVSSTPIRNMATLAGNFVNASPIGDMTVWFLALDAELTLSGSGSPQSAETRTLALKDLYLGYKQLAKQPDEIITTIRFQKPASGFKFNFEKVCKRTYLDIATANTAISLTMDGPRIANAHISAGGVGPIPMYLRETSAYLTGREVHDDAVNAANEIMQSEISPISDVRGTAEYKRLLLRQLFRAHFLEIFGVG